MTGREFRKIRLQLGLTQGALARRFDMNRETVNAWECGRRRIPTVTEFAMRYLVLQAAGKGKAS